MDRNQEGSYQPGLTVQHGILKTGKKHSNFHRSESASLFILETLRTSALILDRASHSEDVDWELPTALWYELLQLRRL